MKRMIAGHLIAAALFAWSASAVAGTNAGLPSDDEVRGVLRDAIETDKRSIGMVVGLISADGVRIIGYGRLGPADDRVPDGDTVFEIGSISKTFTGTLLADMSLKGEVSIEDPVSKFLPKGTKTPVRGGREIRLQDLATHTSGLPRMPMNHRPVSLVNPYADYSEAELYEFLSSVELGRDIGARREYSNIGYGLLGFALSRRAGMGYEALVLERITGPLGMTSTSISLSSDQKSRLAVGHDAELRPVGNWDLSPPFAGAGAIRSTVNDMLKYIGAHMGLTSTPISAALSESQRLQVVCGDGVTRSLAWGAPEQIRSITLVAHNGGTGGYHSFAGFDAKTKRGVVLLSNCTADVDDIGVHLLAPEFPISRVRQAILVPAETLDRYTGVYEIGPGQYREISRYRDRLFLQRTGQPARELVPFADGQFFGKDSAFTLRFDSAAGSGAPTTATVVQRDGTESAAKRVERALAMRQCRNDIAADSYEALTGEYRFPGSPPVPIIVKREGDRLMAQVADQLPAEVFPSDERTFFYTTLDAQLIFESGADGKATAVILRQNGADQRAARAR